jgi:hypothetical protein
MVRSAPIAGLDWPLFGACPFVVVLANLGIDMADITVGTIILAIAIGSMYGAAVGWMFFGGMLILFGLVQVIVGKK